MFTTANASASVPTIATVFHARDPQFKRDVAIKVLPAEFLHDATFRARFEQEAQVLLRLSHANLIRVRDLTRDYRIIKRREGVVGGLVDLLRPRWSTLRAVADVSFDIAPGEMVTIAPSSAGPRPRTSAR